ATASPLRSRTRRTPKSVRCRLRWTRHPDQHDHYPALEGRDDLHPRKGLAQLSRGERLLKQEWFDRVESPPLPASRMSLQGLLFEGSQQGAPDVCHFPKMRHLSSVRLCHQQPSARSKHL